MQLAAILLLVLISNISVAAENKPVGITKELTSVTVMHEGKSVEIL